MASVAGRRLAAILAADVVGYSRLIEDDETRTLTDLKVLRQTILEPLLVENRGRIVKLMGDGVIVEFSSIVAAITCAAAIQSRLATTQDGSVPEHRIVLRIGVHLGDVVVEGEDLLGDGVNIATRLEQLCLPGGVLISGAAYDQLAGKLDLQFVDAGERRLKNIKRPVRAFQLTPEGAPVRQAPEPSLTEKPAVAVLPFANLSGDPEQQYFSDGITEDIIIELSRYHSLRAIARNSCFQFRSEADVAAVRGALGVNYVVVGSVRRAGSWVRVNAQLIDAVNRTQVWAERYDRENRDIFAVQDEVSAAIVGTLKGRIAASGAEQVRRKPPADWVAYDYLLRGRECNYRYLAGEAELFFSRAIELDPTYAQAHAWRAISLGIGYLSDERPETLDAAFASAREALELDDNDAMCHRAMAYVALRRCEFDLAGHHHDRASALNPNDPEIMAQRANWLMHVGRLEEALAALNTSLERDPFPPTWVWDTRGFVLYHLKRYNEAVLAFRNVRAEYFWLAGMLAAAHAQAGQSEDARRELTRYLALRPGVALATVADKIIYADPQLHEHWLEGLRKAGLPE